MEVTTEIRSISLNQLFEEGGKTKNNWNLFPGLFSRATLPLEACSRKRFLIVRSSILQLQKGLVSKQLLQA
jgi:hypothetical protein